MENTIQQSTVKRSPLARIPAEGTAAAAGFAKAMIADLRFFMFIIENTAHTDYVSYVARHALEGKDWDREFDAAVRLAEVDPGVRTKFLRANQQALLEMFLSRLVDAFQKYLVDVIREILHSKPALLSTRQQSLTLEELLKYENIEALVHDVIERKVNAMSYEGFTELDKWCAERGIEIKISNARRARIIELIATRNIIAHNRGRVDERYARIVRGSKFQIGTSRVLDVDYFFDASSVLSDIVFKTDKVARGKFDLKAVPLRTGQPPK